VNLYTVDAANGRGFNKKEKNIAEIETDIGYQF